MTYENLVLLLQRLEQKWRGIEPPQRTRATNPYRELIRDGPHSIQYFACSNHTWRCAASLPIVVDVGINYTQDQQTIPDERPDYSHVARIGPRVEDKIDRTTTFEKNCIESFNHSPEVWRSGPRRLAAPAMQSPLLQSNVGAPLDEFHLVMTNLSPWITTKEWSALPPAKTQLLDFPPHRPSGMCSRFGHLYDLCDELGNDAVLWIGHGVEAVHPFFDEFVHDRKIPRWLKTANTASGNLPKIQNGRIVFRRA